MKKIFNHCLLAWVIINPLLAQVVYDPLSKATYTSHEKLSHKGLINAGNLIKSSSKKYIFRKVKGKSKSKIEMLTELEKDELEFYEKERLDINNKKDNHQQNIS